DGKRLKNAQQNGEVARVLADVSASDFALSLQALEIRPGYRHQLQDDGCGDIGHDAQSKNGEPPEIAAAEQIDNAEHRALVLLEELRQNIRVDARCGEE